MNLSINAIHLFLVLQGIKLRGHLGTLAEMGDRVRHPSRESIQDMRRRTHANRNDRHHNDLHASFRKGNTASHGGSKGGVFGPTGSMSTNLLRDDILNDLGEHAMNGNVFAQHALNDIAEGRDNPGLSHSMGMMNKMNADKKPQDRKEYGGMDDLDEMNGLDEAMHHAVDHMTNNGLEEMKGHMQSEGNIADAIAAQENDPRIAEAANKEEAMSQLAKASGFKRPEEEIKAIAHKVGEAAARAALKNGASIEEAEEAGKRQEAAAARELNEANNNDKFVGGSANFGDGHQNEENSGRQFNAAEGAEMGSGSDIDVPVNMIPRSKEDQQAQAAMQAEAAALDNGATPEEAKNAGLEAAKAAAIAGERAAAGGAEKGAIMAGNIAHDKALAEGATPLEAHIAGDSEAQVQAAAGGAAMAGKMAHDEALENGATPFEANMAGEQAAKGKAAATAGKIARDKALANGATPFEANMAGEQAAKDTLNALGANQELAKAQGEEIAAKEEAKEADKMNAMHSAAEEAAGNAAMESATSGLPERKALTNADKAGREAAAGMAGESAAADAMEKGATAEEAEAIGNLAADSAKALGMGAQVDPALHEANKQEEEANLAEAEKEIEGSMKSRVKEKAKGLAADIKNADSQEAFGVIGTVPDDSNAVNLSKGHIDLPLKSFSGENPKTEEEKEAKNEQDALAEKLRNKITKDHIPSPLNVIKGEDGYMNIPESAKKIEIKEGTVYYPESAKEEMKKAGKDVSQLKHKFNTGERKDRPMGEGYYIANASGFEMDLSSPLNKSPLKVLSGKNGVLDISGASGIDILSGKLNLIPWKQYSKGLHPDFNLETFAKEGVERTKEQRNFEEQLETLANTKAEVITNPSGKQFVKFTPPVGVSEQIPANELASAEEVEFNKNNDSGQDGLSMLQSKSSKEPARSLNIAQNAPHGEGAMEGAFEKKVEQNAKKDSEASLIVSETNSFDPTKETKPRTKKEEKTEITEKAGEDENDQKCPATERMLKNINDILKENSEKFGAALGMTQTVFATTMAKIPESAMKVFLQYECKKESKEYQEEYRKAYDDLKTVFDKNAEPMIKIIGNVMNAAKQRSRPARVISTRIVRRPVTRKIAVYPKIIRSAKTNKIIQPKVVSSKTIINFKPTLVEKKILTPVKEVVIRKGPVLSNKNPPVLKPIKNHVVLNSDGSVAKESTQRDLPPNPK